MPTYTLSGCTIEVAKGGQSAKATRHFDKDGKTLQPPEVKEFKVIAEDDAPTPQVQAERWAKGKDKPAVPAAEGKVGTVAIAEKRPAVPAGKPKAKK